MIKILIFLTSLTFLVDNGVHGWREWLYGDKILLSDIENVVGIRGRMTNARISAPIPQLECISGGSAGCGRFQPEVVTCYNRGGTGLDVRWKCYAIMEPGYEFGRIDVNCEGYSFRGDPYVLANSCAIRYTLNAVHSYYNPLPSRDRFPSAGTMFIIFVVLCFFAVICCLALMERPFDPNNPGAYRSTYYDYYTRPRTEVVYVNGPPYIGHGDAYAARTVSRRTTTTGEATTSSRGNDRRDGRATGSNDFATSSSR